MLRPYHETILPISSKTLSLKHDSMYNLPISSTSGPWRYSIDKNLIFHALNALILIRHLDSYIGTVRLEPGTRPVFTLVTGNKSNISYFKMAGDYKYCRTSAEFYLFQRKKMKHG